MVIGNVDFVKPALNKFLRQLIEILLFRDLDSSIVDAASEALLSLICAERVRQRKREANNSLF